MTLHRPRRPAGRGRLAPNRSEGRAEGGNSVARWVRTVALTGAFLLGLSTFQAEFDFGVPQFRFVFAPMLVMLAAGVSLVAARVWLGRGAAIGAALFFLVVRGGIALIVGPVLGQSTPLLPALPGLGGRRRAGRAAHQLRPPAALRARRGPRHRHRRPRLRVGLVAADDADPLADRAAARGRGARLRDGDRRRAARRLDGRAPCVRPPAAHTPSAPRPRSARRVVVGGLVLFGLQKPADEGVSGTISIAEALERSRPRGQSSP